MTYLVERLVELRRHLDHLRAIRPRFPDREALETDLSLHNDVLYSLLTVCQLVIDIAGELSAQRREAFDDYTQAVRNLGHDPRFSPELVERLAQLPGFPERVDGEAAVLPRLPQSPFDQTMALPYHLYVISTQVPGMPLAIQHGTALVLLTLVLSMNLAATIIRSYFRRRRQW